MRKIVFIVFLIGFNLITYFEFREILWSIIWAEKRGKYRKLIQYKRELKKDSSVIDRISMNYLTDFLGSYKQAFIFWIRMKRLFVISGIFILLIYFVFTAYKRHYEFGFFEDYFLMIYSLAYFLVIRLQFREGKYTKYDLERMKNK